MPRARRTWRCRTPTRPGGRPPTRPAMRDRTRKRWFAGERTPRPCTSTWTEGSPERRIPGTSTAGTAATPNRRSSARRKPTRRFRWETAAKGMRRRRSTPRSTRRATTSSTCTCRPRGSTPSWRAASSCSRRRRNTESAPGAESVGSAPLLEAEAGQSLAGLGDSGHQLRIGLAPIGQRSLVLLLGFYSPSERFVDLSELERGVRVVPKRTIVWDRFLGPAEVDQQLGDRPSYVVVDAAGGVPPRRLSLALLQELQRTLAILPLERGISLDDLDKPFGSRGTQGVARLELRLSSPPRLLQRSAYLGGATFLGGEKRGEEVVRKQSVRRGGEAQPLRIDRDAPLAQGQQYGGFEPRPRETPSLAERLLHTAQTTRSEIREDVSERVSVPALSIRAGQPDFQEPRMNQQEPGRGTRIVQHLECRQGAGSLPGRSPGQRGRQPVALRLERSTGQFLEGRKELERASAVPHVERGLDRVLVVGGERRVQLDRPIEDASGLLLVGEQLVVEVRVVLSEEIGELGVIGIPAAGGSHRLEHRHRSRDERSVAANEHGLTLGETRSVSRGLIGRHVGAALRPGIGREPADRLAETEPRERERRVGSDRSPVGL